MGVSAIATVGGEGGAGGGGGAVRSRDRCGRAAAAGRAILGITISHFASGPDGPAAAGFKAWFDEAWFDKAWFGFVVATSIPGAGSALTATGLTGLGIACIGTGAGLA